MPTDDAILGFSNRWYPITIRTATWLAIASDLSIQVASAPAFLGTKWIALDQRGHGNALVSHDFEDIATVVAGRPEVLEEVRGAPPELRAWLASRTQQFLHDRWAAEDAIGGALPDAYALPGYTAMVIARFEAIAGL